MNKFRGKYDILVEETLFRFQQGGFLAGDYVKIKKNALQHEAIQPLSAQMKAMIDSAIKSGLNLRISYIKSAHAEAMSGPVGAPNVPKCLWADVVFEYAPGLWKDPMTLPLDILEKVEMANPATGFAPVPDSMKRPGPDASQLNPSEVKNTDNWHKEQDADHNLPKDNKKLSYTKDPKTAKV